MQRSIIEVKQNIPMDLYVALIPSPSGLLLPCPFKSLYTSYATLTALLIIHFCHLYLAISSLKLPRWMENCIHSLPPEFAEVRSQGWGVYGLMLGCNFDHPPLLAMLLRGDGSWGPTTSQWLPLPYLLYVDLLTRTCILRKGCQVTTWGFTFLVWNYLSNQVNLICTEG